MKGVARTQSGSDFHHGLLGVGMYRVDIGINGIFVVHAVFALK